MTATRQMRSVLLLPFNATVTLPVLMLWWMPWKLGFGRGSVATVLGCIVGMLCVVLGLTLMVTTMRLFARVGRGTLAPWDPTAHLVVEGPYRYVRNPMISGVEPGLVKRFGDDYREYAKQVPRWIPRWKPWSPAGR